jgi:CheY-like chemotaxis protein
VLHSDDEKDAEPEGEVPALELAPMVFPQPYRILVVEDSFLLVMALEDVFKTLGWELVGPASRLAEALELARTETFDAALLDVDLDGDRSWDVAVLLKARGLPFVFSTGYNTATVLPAHLAGSAVIRKPYNIDELEQKLRHVMGASVN